MLTPEGYIHFEAAPMHSNFNSTGDWIFLAHPIKYNIDGANEYLPQTVQTEEMPEHIEIFALQ